MGNNSVLEAAVRRFACKHYSERKIEKKDLFDILESGRLAPTSFGMEMFDIHVCRSGDIIDACCYQESMKTAPVTIVITVKKAKYYDPDGEFVHSRGSRFPGTIEEYIEDFRGYCEMMKREGKLDMWAKSQGYIPLSFMMLTAAEKGIESCAIEGFDNDRLIDKLGLDRNEDQVSCCLALGYPDETRERIRRPLEDIVTFHGDF